MTMIIFPNKVSSYLIKFVQEIGSATSLKELP